jgi:hypothetical protein
LVYNTSMAEDKFTVSFKKEALEKLRELAKAIGVPEDNLGEVILKGIKVLDLAKDGKLIIEKADERLEVDLKKV